MDTITLSPLGRLHTPFTVDMLDGSPLLDIKPYVPAFDVRDTERIGWFAGKVGQVYQARSDDRFA